MARAPKTSWIIENTGDVRRKLLDVWRQVDEKSISASEARLHISLARAVLETLKVEIAAAHLTQSNIPSITLSGRTIGLTGPTREQ